MTSKAIQNQARRVALDLGHALGTFKPYTRHKASTRCRKCELLAIINARPKPGERKLSGSALLSMCPGKPLHWHFKNRPGILP